MKNDMMKKVKVVLALVLSAAVLPSFGGVGGGYHLSLV